MMYWSGWEKAQWKCWPALMLAIILACSNAAHAKINLKKLEKQKWAQVTTDNFTVISDQGEKTAFKLAEKLEMFRKSYGVIGSVALPEDARPVKVISVKRNKTYKLLTSGNDNLKNTAGFFSDRLSGNYAVVNAGHTDSSSTSRQTSTSILFHEYTHYLAASLSRVNLPYWFNEGLADYLSQIKFPNLSTIKLGLPIEYHLYGLHQMHWKSMEEILKATHISHKQRKDRYRIYSQSWLMIHYMKSDSERGKQLDRYLRLVNDGSSVDDAFKESFAISYAELNRRLKIYMGQRRFGYTEFRLKEPWTLEQFTSRKLAPADALYELGELLLNGRNERDTAQQMFERTLEIDPQHASAMAGLANIHMFSDLDQARTVIEKAKSLGPDNAWVSTIAGHIYARYARQSDDEEQHTSYWNQAVRNYNHAINSGGTNLEAISSAASLYISRGRWEKAKELVEIAYDFAPSNYDLRQQLIVVNYALGEIESAEHIVQLVKRNNHMSEAAMESFDNWVNEVRGQLDVSISITE